MVVALFLVALVSFAVMGLFIVGLSLYGGLKRKAERADLAADALVALFAARRDLMPEVEAISAELARMGACAQPEPPHSLRETSAALADIAGVDASLRRFAAHVTGEAARARLSPGRLATLERRLQEADVAIAGALRAYNVSATEFNDARSLVPAALVARLSGLGERALLDGVPRS